MNNTVLCVEDEEDYQLLVQKILGRAGISVKIAELGAEALRRLEQERPAVLLLDINLPDANGYDLCTQIRQSYRADELPIIMLTVRRRPEEWLKGFSCGASDYIAKPINPAELTERVRFHLQECPDGGGDALSAEFKLIRSAVDGNRSAFDVLVQKYRKRLMESLSNAVKDEHHMEDVISHTLAMALERLPAFRGDSAFFTWLYRIAMNECLLAYRRPAPLSLDTLLQNEQAELVPAFAQEKTEEELYAAQEMGRHAMKSFEQLPRPYRRVMELYCLKDFSYESIARKMRIPEGTVMSRLHKARQLLQEAWTKTLQ